MATLGEIPYRTLGRTGEKVSLLGVGGFHIGLPPDEQEGIGIVRRALDEGVNFLDNCWSYLNGRSEERMGKALRDGYRDKAFLMTKIDGRTKQAAAAQIDDSLRRLRVDHVDLLQFHEVIRFEDAERVFGPDGALEAVLAAKQAGKVRYIGFTGHKDPAFHLRMLETAAANGFAFDAVQMPLNVMDAHFRSFQHEVLPVLRERGIGALAMKSLGSYTILMSRAVAPIECMQYVMNLPISTLIAGIDSQERLDQALHAVRTFQPWSQAEIEALLARTAAFARVGRFEIFKTTTVHDSTTYNPQWLG
ncbi:MAG: aldo/keto reductase [Chloroflexota bacterium]